MKPLIREAILLAREHRRSRNVYGAGNDVISAVSLHTLDLSPGEFQSHFLTLWAYFQTAYAPTPDSWSVQVSSLGLHHRALDLALISLATMRLSLCGQRNTYQVFSLSAYNVSLQIFRRLLQDDSQASNALLVVISLIFTLFEGSQQQPSRIYRSGWADHLQGALSLMQRHGPCAFQTGGFHAAFKKIREMAVCATSFLSCQIFTKSLRDLISLFHPTDIIFRAAGMDGTSLDEHQKILARSSI